jgi:nucleotide-binding universal stress UspA family protein
MPLKLNVVVSRKVGESNYGSRGATVGLEVELASGLVHDSRKLRARVAKLFRFASASVDEELKRSRGSAVPITNGGSKAPSRDRPATAAQLRAIQATAERHGIDLKEELQSRFGIGRPEELSLQRASQLIDALNKSFNGSADHAQA